MTEQVITRSKTNVAASLKASRKALDLTQRELADKLGVSQALVSKWEKDGEIPAMIKFEAEELLGQKLDDLELLGTEENMELWSEYLKKALKECFGNKPSTGKDCLNELGISSLLAPLKSAGVDLLKSPYEFDEALFESLTDFFLFRENIEDAVGKIHVHEQLTDSDAETLWAQASEYAWVLVAASDEWLSEVSDEAEDYFTSASKRFEENLYASWLNVMKDAKQSNSLFITPMWEVGDVLEACQHGMDEFPEIDIKTLLMEGKTADPSINKLIAIQEANAISMMQLDAKLNKVLNLLQTSKQ